MADYYEEFSETIDNLTAEEEQWIRAELGVQIDEMEEEELTAWAKERDMSLDEAEMWNSWSGDIIENLKGKSLWIHSEQGIYDCMALFIQSFIKKLRPKDTFALTWAATCSKPRAGNQFGGGAFYVTADEIKWHTVWQWLSEQEALHQKEVA